MYCSADDVYAATSLDSGVVSEANVNSFILAAEREVDLYTSTTHWSTEDSGTASSGTGSTIVDSTKSWTENAYADNYVWIYSGAGSGQIRTISSNDDTTLTLSRDWSTNPDNTSKYRIIYTASDALVDTPSLDGTGTHTLFLPYYPIRLIESCSINSTDITVSSLYTWDKIGKIRLGDDSEKGTFDDSKPQLIDINWWYGDYPIKAETKRLCIVLASLSALESQMGGTYNVPSTYSLPEGSVTIGQAYINIRGTYDVLMKEKDMLLKRVIRRPVMF